MWIKFASLNFLPVGLDTIKGIFDHSKIKASHIHFLKDFNFFMTSCFTVRKTIR